MFCAKPIGRRIENAGDGESRKIDSFCEPVFSFIAFAGTQELESRFLTEALGRNGGNVTKAAEEVGIQRTQMHALMRKYGLTPASD